MPTHKPYRSPLLSYFEYSHLPSHLQAISKPFAELAEVIDHVLSVELEMYRKHLARTHRKALDQVWHDLAELPDNLRAAYLQTEAALQKLIEAKDCAVRAGVSIVKASKECEHTEPISVIVNGQRVSFTKDVITFRELVDSLNMKGNPSVTVKGSRGGFSFKPDQSLELEPDLVINMVHTGNA